MAAEKTPYRILHDFGFVQDLLRPGVLRALDLGFGSRPASYDEPAPGAAVVVAPDQEAALLRGEGVDGAHAGAADEMLEIGFGGRPRALRA